MLLRKEDCMKSLRTALIGLAVFGMVVFFSGVSFVKEGCSVEKENHEAKIKLLQDSAAAPQKLNPDLAKGLEEMAEGKHKEAMGEKNEEGGVGEKVEPKSEQGESIK